MGLPVDPLSTREMALMEELRRKEKQVEQKCEELRQATNALKAHRDMEDLDAFLDDLVSPTMLRLLISNLGNHG